MNWDNDRLPARALTFFYAVAVGVTPPFLAVRAAGPGGSYTRAAGLLMVMGPAATLVWLVARQPGVRFPDLLERLLGRALGRIAAVAYLALWGGSAGLLLRLLGEEVRFFLLPSTPLWVILLLASAAAFLAVAHGVEPLGRTLFIIVPPAYLAALAFMLAAVLHGEPGLAMAFPEQDPAELVSRAAGVAGPVGGFTSLLVLGGHLRDGAALPGAAASGLGLAAGFLRLLAFTASASVLSVPGMALYHWPIVSAMQTAVLPGFLVEKLDLFFLTAPLLLSWARCAATIWLVSTGLRELLAIRHGALPALAAVLAALALALRPA